MNAERTMSLPGQPWKYIPLGRVLALPEIEAKGNQNGSALLDFVSSGQSILQRIVFRDEQASSRHSAPVPSPR